MQHMKCEKMKRARTLMIGDASYFVQDTFGKSSTFNSNSSHPYDSLHRNQAF